MVPEGTILPDPFDGVTVNGVPEQTVVVCAVTLGIGSTVTVSVNVEPVQAPEIGVKV